MIFECITIQPAQKVKRAARALDGIGACLQISAQGFSERPHALVHSHAHSCLLSISNREYASVSENSDSVQA